MKMFLTFGALFAALAVILGAFGAHALKSKLSPDQLMVFETGVRYQFYHSLALIFVFLLFQRNNSVLLNYSGWFFFAGILLFSGSLFLLSCKELLFIHKLSPILGPITPFGGLSFVAGWICMIIASLKMQS